MHHTRSKRVFAESHGVTHTQHHVRRQLLGFTCMCGRIRTTPQALELQFKCVRELVAGALCAVCAVVTTWKVEKKAACIPSQTTSAYAHDSNRSQVRRFVLQDGIIIVMYVRCTRMNVGMYIDKLGAVWLSQQTVHTVNERDDREFRTWT
jgi:hypothetical protein